MQGKGIVFGGLGIAAVLVAPPGAAAASMQPPSCEALAAWAGTVNPRDLYNVAPRVALPKAFEEPRFSSVFGLPALGWTQADVQAAKQAIDGCYQEARKRRDRDAGNALVSANRELIGDLPKVLAALQRAKDAAASATKAIDALPDSAELGRGLEIVLKANPAAPDMSPLNGLPRPVAEPVYHLAQTLPVLADGEREPIFKALAERRAKIAAAIAGDAEKRIAAAPATAAGVVALMEERQGLDKLSDAAERTRLAQQIAERIKQIRDGLRQARPAVWIPPDCGDLYRWAGEPGANQGVTLGRTTIWQMLSDPRAVPVFGISLADWTDDDLAQFGKVQDSCRAEAAALNRARSRGPLTTEETKLLEAAARTGWITDPSHNTPFAYTRSALLDYRTALAELQAAEDKIAALPDTVASMAPLNAMRNQPSFNKVGQDEFNRFRDVFNRKLQAIATHVTEAAITGLAEVKVAELGDLAKLRDYAAKTQPTIPMASGQQQFNAAYDRAMRDAATRLLPPFQAKLDAMPASIDGVGQAKTAVAKLTGITDQGRMASLQLLHDAAEKRVDAMIGTMRAEACDGLLSSLGAGSAAKLELWDGRKGVLLRDWICGLAAQGATVSSWSGAGFLSRTSTVQVTMPHGSLRTFSLHKAEVKPGKTMLVGFAMKDANQEKNLSVDEWAGLAAGVGAETVDRESCRRFEKTEPDRVTAADKPFWLQCVLQMGGLGRRGL